MSIDDVYLISGKIAPARVDELKELEATIGAPLPLGYAEYMTRLGEGEYCDILEVYTPAKVLKWTERGHADLHEFFEEISPSYQDVLALNEVRSGFCFGFMFDGPYKASLYHVPGKRHPAYALIPYHEHLYWLEGGFQRPLDWTCLSGKCEDFQDLPFLWFESRVRRMIMCLDHFEPISVEVVRDTLLRLFPGGVTKYERSSNSGGLLYCVLLNPRIGARFSIGRHAQDLDEHVRAVRVHATVNENPDGTFEAGADVRIDFDRGALGEVEEALKHLVDHGFTERFRRIR